MKFGSSSLPTEILFIICLHLPKKDALNARKVCRDFSSVITPFIFKRLYISVEKRDITALIAVSQHPILSKYVEEIVYDSAIRSSALDKNNYCSMLGTKNNVDQKLDEWRLEISSKVKFTKAAVARGYRLYSGRYWAYYLLQDYSGPNMTYCYSKYPPLDDFSSLLMDPAHHSDVWKYLPRDLACLVFALPHLPRIKRFTISDTRYIYAEKHYSHIASLSERAPKRMTFAIYKEGFRGLDKVVVDPCTWPTYISLSESKWGRSTYRGFFVLVQAASMTNLRSLHNFGYDIFDDRAGLPLSLFQLTPTQLTHTLNAFSTLRRVDLRINTSPYVCGYSIDLRKGHIAKILAASWHLEHLSLQFCDLASIASLDNLLGTQSWHQLSSVFLGNMVLHEREFLNFFDRHRSMLRSLHLHQVCCFPLEQGPIRPLSNAFKEMARGDLALTELTYDALQDEVVGTWHADNAAKVLDFLLTDGTAYNAFGKSTYNLS
ncbi:hypothetical protein MMC12_003286 [Toensbergia leucococca]|nr:hypothetical protein [Toensbergia leucococca]